MQCVCWLRYLCPIAWISSHQNWKWFFFLLLPPLCDGKWEWNVCWFIARDHTDENDAEQTGGKWWEKPSLDFNEFNCIVADLEKVEPKICNCTRLQEFRARTKKPNASQKLTEPSAQSHGIRTHYAHNIRNEHWTGRRLFGNINNDREQTTTQENTFRIIAANTWCSVVRRSTAPPK